MPIEPLDLRQVPGSCPDTVRDFWIVRSCL